MSGLHGLPDCVQGVNRMEEILNQLDYWTNMLNDYTEWDMDKEQSQRLLSIITLLEVIYEYESILD